MTFMVRIHFQIQLYCKILTRKGKTFKAQTASPFFLGGGGVARNETSVLDLSIIDSGLPNISLLLSNIRQYN